MYIFSERQAKNIYVQLLVVENHSTKL